MQVLHYFIHNYKSSHTGWEMRKCFSLLVIMLIVMTRHEQTPKEMAKTSRLKEVLLLTLRVDS